MAVARLHAETDIQSSKGITLSSMRGFGLGTLRPSAASRVTKTPLTPPTLVRDRVPTPRPRSNRRSNVRARPSGRRASTRPRRRGLRRRSRTWCGCRLSRGSPSPEVALRPRSVDLRRRHGGVRVSSPAELRDRPTAHEHEPPITSCGRARRRPASPSRSSSGLRGSSSASSRTLQPPAAARAARPSAAARPRPAQALDLVAAFRAGRRWPSKQPARAGSSAPSR